MFARIASTARVFGRRTFATAEAHEAEHAAITRTWKKRTFLAIPVVGAVAVMNVFIHMSHGHHEAHDVHHYSYQRKLVKYPWSPHECNLFDVECKRAYYNKATGKSGH